MLIVLLPRKKKESNHFFFSPRRKFFFCHIQRMRVRVMLQLAYQQPKMEEEKMPPPPPRRPTARTKGFVRPNCSTTFWLQCPVCCKRYFKNDAHFDCFSRWCELCQDSVTSPEAFVEHAQQYHAKNYCAICRQVYENLKGHCEAEHPEGAVSKRGGRMAKNRKDRTPTH